MCFFVLTKCPMTKVLVVTFGTNLQMTIAFLLPDGICSKGAYWESFSCILKFYIPISRYMGFMSFTHTGTPEFTINSKESHKMGPKFVEVAQQCHLPHEPLAKQVRQHTDFQKRT